MATVSGSRSATGPEPGLTPPMQAAPGRQAEKQRRSGFLFWCPVVCGTVVALLGLMVALAWITGAPLLLRLQPANPRDGV